MITSHIKETQRLRSGDLLVLTKSEEGSVKLRKATKLADIAIQVEAHKYLNQCRGVIYSRDLMYMATEEICQELSTQNVVKVDRIKQKRNGELSETPLHILTFGTTEMPRSIKAGFLMIHVRPYIPSPMRCHTCQRYGHTKARCFRKETCPKCGTEINEEHPAECNNIKCINCDGTHAAYDIKCPIYVMEKEIIKIKTLDRITYFTAKERYYRENANTTGASQTTKKTYSEILHKNNETNNGKTTKNITTTKSNNNNNKTDNNNNKTTKIIENNINTIEKDSNNKNSMQKDNNSNINNNKSSSSSSNNSSSSSSSSNNNTNNNKNNNENKNTTNEEKMEQINQTIKAKYCYLSPAELAIMAGMDEPSKMEE